MDRCLTQVGGLGLLLNTYCIAYESYVSTKPVCIKHVWLKSRSGGARRQRAPNGRQQCCHASLRDQECTRRARVENGLHIDDLLRPMSSEASSQPGPRDAGQPGQDDDKAVMSGQPGRLGQCEGALCGTSGERPRSLTLGNTQE